MQLFISDLHLDDARPDISRAFFRFLAEKASAADTLYILGDFFESWVGDDDPAELGRDVANALQQLSQGGCRIFIMHGNRDFLIGDGFCRRAGATLLPDPTVIELGDTPTLLMHGDSLCTDDADYMQLRTMLRSPGWQQDVLSKPLAERQALAQQLRMASKQANSNKAEDIMDVNAAEVQRVMTHYDCPRLIHGHTHRPARHDLATGALPRERIVLGDWDHTARYLQQHNGALTLLDFPI